MAKKKRPSLANYLVTGKVHWEPDEPSPSEEAPEEETAPAGEEPAAETPSQAERAAFGIPCEETEEPRQEAEAAPAPTEETAGLPEDREVAAAPQEDAPEPREETPAAAFPLDESEEAARAPQEEAADGSPEETAPVPQKSAEQLERESRFLAMLSDSDRSEWAPRFDARESRFDSLQVKELRSAFEEGRLEGRILKLRRRRSPLEPVETGKDLSFPILAVFLETDDSITLWCNHLD